MNSYPLRHSSFRRGMTLVEVLAVVVILGLLAGTLAIGFSALSTRANESWPRLGSE